MRPLLKNLFLLLILSLVISCSGSDNELNFPKAEIPLPEALLEIYYPPNGATLAANKPFTLKYSVVRGGTGSYVEIQIDEEETAIIDKTYGEHYIEELPPGSHTIKLTEYTKSHTPTGGEAIIHITMEKD